MSRRASAEPLTKVTLNLFQIDYARLQDLYPKIGATVAVREIVRQHLAKVEAKTARALDETLVEEIVIDVEELEIGSE